jgi:regulatory protein
LLNYRLRSKKELTVALLDKGYLIGEVNQALEQLEAVGLIDDPRFAQLLAETRVSVSRRGRQAIFFELLKKGVAKDLIETTLGQLDEEAELEAARSLAESRLRQWRSLEPLKRRQRLLSLLQRRGFPSSVIRQVVKEVAL